MQLLNLATTGKNDGGNLRPLGIDFLDTLAFGKVERARQVRGVSDVYDFKAGKTLGDVQVHHVCRHVVVGCVHVSHLELLQLPSGEVERAAVIVSEFEILQVSEARKIMHRLEGVDRVSVTDEGREFVFVPAESPCGRTDVVVADDEARVKGLCWGQGHRAERDGAELDSAERGVSVSTERADAELRHTIGRTAANPQLLRGQVVSEGLAERVRREGAARKPGSFVLDVPVNVICRLREVFLRLPPKVFVEELDESVVRVVSAGEFGHKREHLLAHCPDTRISHGGNGEVRPHRFVDEIPQDGVGTGEVRRTPHGILELYVRRLGLTAVVVNVFDGIQVVLAETPLPAHIIRVLVLCEVVGRCKDDEEHVVERELPHIPIGGGVGEETSPSRRLEQVVLLLKREVFKF